MEQEKGSESQSQKEKNKREEETKKKKTTQYINKINKCGDCHVVQRKQLNWHDGLGI